MKKFVLLLVCFAAFLEASEHRKLTQKIVKELNYIFQNRAHKGGTTFEKELWFEYRFRTIDDFTIEITAITDAKKVYVLDMRNVYSVTLEEDVTCQPALIFSHDEEIIYLYVKERCGVFGGYNLYPRAKDALVRIKGYMFELSRLNQKAL